MKFSKDKNLLSLILIFISLFLWIIPVQKEAPWKKNKVITWDVISYYAYLPAAFIYDDITLSFKNNLPPNFPGKIWATKIKGRDTYVSKMTMGTAIMYSPFFFIAHQHAKLYGYDANGYTEPYSRWLMYSAIFYIFLSMIILRRTLLKFFDDPTVTISLIIIYFGTNLYYYTAYRGPMSHAYSFFLVTCFLNLAIRWHNTPQYWKSILMGLILGLVTIIRPTNVLIFLFPLFYKVYSVDTAKQKLELLKNKWGQILTIAALSIIVTSPQLFYWKYITGDWIYRSYGEEGFFFLKPQILKGLFSFRKGWLLYTPLMALAVIGIPFLFKKMKDFAFPISIFFILNIWVIFSWWSWWYGASFSARPMIDSYPILAFPLALVISYFLKNKWSFILGVLLIAFFVRLNIFQTKQYKLTLLHFDSMTKELYYTIWDKMYFPDNYKDLVQKPDYKSAIKGEEEKFDKE